MFENLKSWGYLQLLLLLCLATAKSTHADTEGSKPIECSSIHCSSPPEDFNCTETTITNPKILKKLGNLKECCPVWNCTDETNIGVLYLGLTGSDTNQVPSNTTSMMSMTLISSAPESQDQENCTNVTCPIYPSSTDCVLVYNKPTPDLQVLHKDHSNCCPKMQCVTKEKPTEWVFVITGGNLPNDSKHESAAATVKPPNCAHVVCSPKPTELRNATCEEKPIQGKLSAEEIESLGNLQQCCPTVWQCTNPDKSMYIVYEIARISFWHYSMRMIEPESEPHGGMTLVNQCQNVSCPEVLKSTTDVCTEQSAIPKGVRQFAPKKATCCPVHNCTSSNGLSRVSFSIQEGETPTANYNALNSTSFCDGFHCTHKPKEFQICVKSNHSDSIGTRLGQLRDCCPVWDCEDDGVTYQLYQIRIKRGGFHYRELLIEKDHQKSDKITKATSHTQSDDHGTLTSVSVGGLTEGDGDVQASAVAHTGGISNALFGVLSAVSSSTKVSKGGHKGKGTHKNRTVTKIHTNHTAEAGPGSASEESSTSNNTYSHPITKAVITEIYEGSKPNHPSRAANSSAESSFPTTTTHSSKAPELIATTQRSITKVSLASAEVDSNQFPYTTESSSTYDYFIPIIENAETTPSSAPKESSTIKPIDNSVTEKDLPVLNTESESESNELTTDAPYHNQWASTTTERSNTEGPSTSTTARSSVTEGPPTTVTKEPNIDDINAPLTNANDVPVIPITPQPQNPSDSSVKHGSESKIETIKTHKHPKGGGASTMITQITKVDHVHNHTDLSPATGPGGQHGFNSFHTGSSCPPAEVCPPAQVHGMCFTDNSGDGNMYKPEKDSCCPLLHCIENTGLHSTYYVKVSGIIPMNPSKNTKDKCSEISCGTGESFASESCSTVSGVNPSFSQIKPFVECCGTKKCSRQDGSYFVEMMLSHTSFTYHEVSFYNIAQWGGVNYMPSMIASKKKTSSSQSVYSANSKSHASEKSFYTFTPFGPINTGNPENMPQPQPFAFRMYPGPPFSQPPQNFKATSATSP